MKEQLEDLDKTDIKSLTYEELLKQIQDMGEKAFRADQIYHWLHVKLAAGFDEMTNISAAFREQCKERFSYTLLKAVRVQESGIDGTKKFLFDLGDGNFVESVFMPYHHGNSLCISSQAGCRMGCQFCASGIDGLSRNLLPSEMLEQIYRVESLTGERISNVVVMGTGEPLDNYDNLVRFIRLLSHKKGLHISQRNITVSTCGIVPGIRRLAEEELQITLAISLHAADDKKRQKLMPIAKVYSIGELMDAVRYYFDKTGRRITFEYSLVSGVNDTYEDAERLSRLVSGLNCHINLIPVNPVKERDFKRPKQTYVEGFKNKLEKNRINVTIRREMGADIDGACGQLRKRHLEEGKEGTHC
ncbi:MAG: 23S rRNA (adenine(2503)-C(2))-methyltransferase RlmN [Lachnospiraceae bacterium]|nr:23S rRNA (adenine(2503)-C(2))-methyltransferase RlmN [Lachnospiraceae bacterium]